MKNKSTFWAIAFALVSAFLFVCLLNVERKLIDCRYLFEQSRNRVDYNHHYWQTPSSQLHVDAEPNQQITGLMTLFSHIVRQQGADFDLEIKDRVNGKLYAISPSGAWVNDLNKPGSKKLDIN